jgi:hypothetical protein
MIWGIPVELLFGVGAGLAAGGIAYALNPDLASKRKSAGLVGVGFGFLAAGATWLVRYYALK